MDGLLTGDALQACEAHRNDCPACRRHDVQIRRSLLALQVLPTIEPSADFHRRLCDRIAHDTVHYTPINAHRVRWGIAAVILAASVALLVAVPSPTATSRSSVAMVQAPVLMGARSRQGPAMQTVALIRPIALPIDSPSASSEKASHRRASAPARERTARFEALAGNAPLRTAPQFARPQSVRLQTVTYIGQ